ncbi:MAG: glutamine--fructose-6-phosphate transaminase (isomerizing) [bacterium]|nr:glutamine--fructose-6-phosphate transaminase (isomerizing) [bacterium]
MCGIAAYIGKKEGLPIVFANLKKLEYRGYDSAGVAFFNFPDDELGINVIKAVGKLDSLGKAIDGHRSLPATSAIGHTRWATHGVPNESNAHPHIDCHKEISLVHNGIVENYKELKVQLTKLGHRFRSQTDTEIIAHLIEEYGFDQALKKIVGAYALAVINKDEPNKIYFARLGSPLVVGIGRGEYYLASDATALAGLVKRVVYLKDGQKGTISLNGLKMGRVRPRIERLDMDLENAQKEGYPHFMLKEIFEGGEVVRAALRGRLFPKKNLIKLGGLESVEAKLARINRLEIAACGTSYYAGIIGKMLFEDFANLPTEIRLASEYRYYSSPLHKNTSALFISQSGETADTLAALSKANSRKYLTLGIVNAVGSSIARETVAGVYNHAGPEIGVASTKAFLSQLAVLNLISLHWPNSRKNKRLLEELALVPSKIESVLKKSKSIKALARKYARYNNFLYIGRGYNYPAAMEGALKLKEISYIHAEGYAAGEMKHGPIALIDKNFPTVAIVMPGRVYEKVISNLEEIKARGGPILAIAAQGDRNIKTVADDVIYVPKTMESLTPLLSIVPLQLFAYYIGVARGHDVDKPRNLAKSVTVE